MKNFKQYITEAWLNRIEPKRSPEVRGSKTYDTPQHFIKNAQQIGNVGPLQLFSSDTAGGGMTHFTWNPNDKKIHHVLYAASAAKSDDGTTLKFLSAHARKNSPVRMSDVYSSLVKDHNRTLVATSHSPGAAKMWDRFHNDNDLQISGYHKDTNQVVRLSRDDQKYVEYTNKDPDMKRLGNMHLVLSKAGSNIKI